MRFSGRRPEDRMPENTKISTPDANTKNVYLLTGCAGFIASNVAEMLLEDGHTVYGLDDRNDAYPVLLKDWRLAQLKRFPKFHFHELNITDRPALEHFFQETLRRENRTSFSACIHLAARAGVRYSAINPWIYFETNVTGTLNLLELCRNSETRKFILASSSSVYGNSTAEIFREDQPTDTPCSPYAASKKSAEALVFSYRHLYGLDASVLRFFTVYGPAGRPDMSILRFIHAIAAEKPLCLYGDGSQARDFTYCRDIASGVIRSLKPVGYSIFNLGGDHTYTVNQLIETIAEQLGKTPRIDRHPAHPADVARTHADISRARTILGWEPVWNFQDGIAQTIEWYLAHQDWVGRVIESA